MPSIDGEVLKTSDAIAKRIALWGGAFIVLVTIWNQVNPYVEHIVPPILLIAGLIAFSLPFQTRMPVSAELLPFICATWMIFCIFGLVGQQLNLTLDITERLSNSVGRIAGAAVVESKIDNPDHLHTSPLWRGILNLCWVLGAQAWAMALVAALYRYLNFKLAHLKDEQ